MAILEQLLSMQSLYGVMKFICTTLSKSVYIGVTESPIWRWDLCRDHTDTDMKAHGDRFDNMYVLCVFCYVLCSFLVCCVCFGYNRFCLLFPFWIQPQIQRNDGLHVCASKSKS